MTQQKKTSICIVGAGSMGVVTGYYLSLGGARVTYLIRPHRQEQLSRAQKLYSYDDNSLKTFSDYELLTDPAQLAGTAFDYILVTLDGAALRSDAGEKLVQAIGNAYRDTQTGVILGSLGIDVKSAFIAQSGLAASRVSLRLAGTLIYEVPNAKLPLHNGVSTELLHQADYGFRHLSPVGLMIDDGAPDVARAFAEVFDRNGKTKCNIMPTRDFAAMITGIAAIGAWEALDWQKLTEFAPSDETWRLGVEAMREFQRLSIFGPEAAAAAEALTPEGVHSMFVGMEHAALPLDFAGFNRYHHGGKVNVQDHQILVEALERGRGEGLDMPALSALVERLSS